MTTFSVYGSSGKFMLTLYNLCFAYSTKGYVREAVVAQEQVLSSTRDPSQYQ